MLAFDVRMENATGAATGAKVETIACEFDDRGLVGSVGIRVVLEDESVVHIAYRDMVQVVVTDATLISSRAQLNSDICVVNEDLADIRLVAHKLHAYQLAVPLLGPIKLHIFQSIDTALDCHDYA